MKTRPHWSYSSINQYLRCPLQFFFQRVPGLPYRKTTSGLVLGSAVHVALAEYHRGLQRNEIVGANGLLKVFHNTWTEREITEEIIYRDGDSRDNSLAQGMNLIETYLKEPPPTGIGGRRAGAHRSLDQQPRRISRNDSGCHHGPACHRRRSPEGSGVQDERTSLRGIGSGIIAATHLLRPRRE